MLLFPLSSASETYLVSRLFLPAPRLPFERFSAMGPWAEKLVFLEV